MSDAEMTPSRTADDPMGRIDDRRTSRGDVAPPTETRIEDETIGIDTGSAGAESPGDDDE